MAPSGPQRRCETCKRKFTRPVGSNRLNCYTCRPVRATVVQLPPVDDELSLTTLTMKALADAGVLKTWQGAACVKLAELIDWGRHGASGAAGNVRAHREAMAFALADTGQEADVISMIFADDTPR
jgi:hypothetical protein